MKQRIRTLYCGYLPCVEYGFERDAIGHDFSLLAGPGLENRVVQIPLSGGTIRIAGHIRSDTDMGGFEHEVQNYEREYRRRYERFLETGEIRPN